MIFKIMIITTGSLSLLGLCCSGRLFKKDDTCKAKEKSSYYVFYYIAILFLRHAQIQLLR